MPRIFTSLRTVPLEKRFWIQTNKNVHGDGCWEWLGAISGNGYAVIRANGRNQRASRAAWFLKTGEWPKTGMFVCHTCDNPKCVRFNHLFLGTPKDNMVDKARKGRSASKERNSQSKLTMQQAREIRALYQASNLSQRYLASAFNVSKRCIWAVLVGETWRESL